MVGILLGRADMGPQSLTVMTEGKGYRIRRSLQLKRHRQRKDSVFVTILGKVLHLSILVIASAAKQSILPRKRKNGLLRCARNDVVDGPTCTASSAKTWPPERHKQGGRPWRSLSEQRLIWARTIFRFTDLRARAA